MAGLSATAYWRRWSLKSAVFWDMMPCGLCKNRHFRGAYPLVRDGPIITLQLTKDHFKEKPKINHGSQIVTWHQDRLADWLLVVMWPILTLDELRLCWRGPVAFINYRYILLSERMPHINESTTDSNRNRVLGPRWVSWKTGRLTIGCKITLTLTMIKNWQTIPFVNIRKYLGVATSSSHSTSWKCKWSQHWTRWSTILGGSQP
jgi:hypothetical protein